MAYDKKKLFKQAKEVLEEMIQFAHENEQEVKFDETLKTLKKMGWYDNEPFLTKKR